MKRLFLTRLLPITVVTAVIPLIAGNFSPASAASLSFSVSPFTGDRAKVNFMLDDTAAGSGKIQFKVDVDQSVSLADLRGVFFNIQDDSLLSGLSLTGTHVTQTAFNAGKVMNFGGGNNLNGGGTSPFDIGLEIGQEGLKGGRDDIRSTIFTLSHNSRALDLKQFTNQSFGVRVTSVGTGTSRGGSSKLSGVAPTLPPVVVVPPTPKPPARVPEPGMTAAIVLSAVGAMKLLKHRLSEPATNEQEC